MQTPTPLAYPVDTVELDAYLKKQRRHLYVVGELYPVILTEEEELKRPQFRSECANVPRPCTFVSCSNHLYWEVIKSDPEVQPEDLDPSHSCVEDVEELGPTPEEEIADILHVKSVRPDVDSGLRKLRLYKNSRRLKKLHDGD